MNRYKLLDEGQNKLVYVLALAVENFLKRRRQTIVFKTGMAQSIHHAHVLIRQRHIRVGRQVVNIPLSLMRCDSKKHIDFLLARWAVDRVKRRNKKAVAKKAAGGDAGKKDED